MFQPIDGLAIKFFVDGDVGHGRGWRRTMPVLLAWGNPDDIPGPNLLDGAAPPLRATSAGSHDQGLTERVRVPCRAGARFERDAPASRARGQGRVEQRVDAHGSCEPLCRSLCRRLGSTSLDVHVASSPLIPRLYQRYCERGNRHPRDGAFRVVSLWPINRVIRGTSFSQRGRLSKASFANGTAEPRSAIRRRTPGA